MSVSPDDLTFLQKLSMLPGRIDQKLQPFGGAANLGAALLANSGYSTTPRTFGSVLGASALQGSQMMAERQNEDIRRKYMEAQIKALQSKQAESPFGNINPSSFTPGSLAKFQKSGDYGDLVPAAGADSADVATFKYWSQLSPEQQQNMLKLKRNVGSDYAIETVNGVPTVVYKPAAGYLPGQQGTPLTTPLTNLPAQAAGAGTIKQAEATGSKTGEALGGIAGGIQTKAANAVGTKNLLDIAEPLIDIATGSSAGAARDAVAKVFGASTTGSEAIASLKVLQAGLMTSMPRMEGPQSDRDVMLYREAAGQIGDPTIPASLKKEAVETIRQIQDKYIERAGGAVTSKYREGQIAKNPKTGETLVFKNGAWVKP